MVATRAGWIGKVEVVEVSFDPRQIPRAELERRGREGCVSESFAPGSALRLVEDQKYYLRQTLLRCVPMTPAQAARVHATASSSDPERWLSPAQRAAAARVRTAPDANWEDLVGVPLMEAWPRYEACLAALAAAEAARAADELSAD